MAKRKYLEVKKTKDDLKKEDLIYATTLQSSCKRKKEFDKMIQICKNLPVKSHRVRELGGMVVDNMGNVGFLNLEYTNEGKIMQHEFSLQNGGKIYFESYETKESKDYHFIATAFLKDKVDIEKFSEDMKKQFPAITFQFKEEPQEVLNSVEDVFKNVVAYHARYIFGLEEIEPFKKVEDNFTKSNSKNDKKEMKVNLEEKTSKKQKSVMAKHKYQPKTKEELRILCEDEKIYLGDIDTSKITDMSYLFENRRLVKDIDFGEPYWEGFPIRKNYDGIEIWDTSHVTNMSHMFDGVKNFNQDISKWNVSNVKDMSYMFYGAESFNQPIGDWDVSHVKKMSCMFEYADSFNQDIGKWIVSNVEDMFCMFNSAKSFNQNIGDWNISNVKDTAFMFSHAVAFNQDINKWDVSRVKDMSYMFCGTKSFNQSLANWNVSNVKQMSHMFDDSNYNYPLDKWDVSNVEDMSSMFEGTKLFNQDINNWNVSNVKDMTDMFYDAKAFNKPLDKWNINKVENMENMFKNAISFKQTLPKEWAEKAGYENPVKEKNNVKVNLKGKSIKKQKSINTNEVEI